MNSLTSAMVGGKSFVCASYHLLNILLFLYIIFYFYYIYFYLLLLHTIHPQIGTLGAYPFLDFCMGTYSKGGLLKVGLKTFPGS